MPKNFGEGNGIEETQEYLIDHPDEITPEDLERFPNFLNNFFMHIDSLSFLLSSKDETERKLGEDLKSVIREAGFNLEEFTELMKKIKELNIQLAQVFMSRDADELRNAGNKLNPLIQKRERAILPLYQRLRQAGYRHYPDLTR